MNTTETLISTGCPATAPQPANNLVKPFKFPAQPQEWKIVSFRECPTPDTMQQCETPDQAAAYWKTHIANHPYFNSECEPKLNRHDHHAARQFIYECNRTTNRIPQLEGCSST